jgi:hypothetical protein
MFKLLLNPFEKYTEKQLLFFGALMLIIGSYIGFLCNGYFDSILHISFIKNTTFVNTIIQNLIITTLLSFILFGIGKIINKKTRFIDVLNVTLIARIPFYFSTLININNKSAELTDKLMINLIDINNINLSTLDYVFLFTTAAFGLVCIVWFAYLLWNGFKIATNAKTNKPVILLIISLLVANYISSYLIQYLK